MTRSAAAQVLVSVRVLWMDDKPDAIKNYARTLQAERSHIEIDIVTSIEEAKAKLQGNFRDYDALVVDCKMDDDDETANGAEFLLWINENYKGFPTFVYSGYWSDLPYKRFIDHSHAHVVQDKQVFDPPLSNNHFFRSIYDVGAQYLHVKHLRPEEIPFPEFIKRPAKYEAATTAHRKKHGHWVRREMKKKNWVWSVVCGDDIVTGDEDIFKLPDTEELKKIGRERNRIPFIYSDPLPIESIPPPTTGGTPWNRTRYANDFYPTLKARFGADFVTDDFDTGATQTVVSSALVKVDPAELWEEATHFNETYRFVQKKVHLTIVDTSGNEQTREIPLRVVDAWDRSPFQKINGSRKILFGRDVFRAFKLEVCLDSEKRRTMIRFI